MWVLKIKDLETIKPYYVNELIDTNLVELILKIAKDDYEGSY